MRKMLRRALIWAPVAIVGLVALWWLVLPWPVRLRWHEPETTSFMRYRVDEAEARGEPLELRHTWVPLDAISQEMVRAVVTAEDGRFRDHGGIDWLALQEELSYDGEPPFSLASLADWKAVWRAGRYYQQNRDEVRGRSTITQQLAKNLYFTPERSLRRKVAELFVAKRLEWFLSKDRILELYLNTVELGPGIFGVEAAAQEYFGRSAADLSRYQAASLAATLPHPLTSNPETSPGRMAWRRDIIVARMGGGGGGGTREAALPVPVAPGPVDVVAPIVDEPGGEPGSGDAPAPAVPADSTAPAVDTVLPLPDTVAPPAVPDTARVGGR